jgi:hypothetical protein
MHIEINWLSDSSDCDQAGCSGGWSEGAIVKVDGNTILELIPKAHCFGGDHWDKDDVWTKILEKLVGKVTVEQWYG